MYKSVFDLSLPFKKCYQNNSTESGSKFIASDNLSSIFIAYQNGKITKINLYDNETNWTSDLGGEINSEFFYENNRIYSITEVSVSAGSEMPDSENKIADSKNRYILRSLNAETGLTLWQIPFDTDAKPFLENFGENVILATRDGGIYSINKNDARINWEKHFNWHLNAKPYVSGNKIYISISNDSKIIIFAANGEINSELDTQNSAVSVLTAFEDKLVYGGKKGFLNLYDPAVKRQLWSVRFGGEISSLVKLPKGILVSSLDNFIYLVSTQKGRTIWKRRLNGRIASEPLIADNFAVFTTSADNNVSIIDLESGRIVNQISLLDLGFLISKPILIQHSIVFPMSSGVYAFAAGGKNCLDNK